jgi:hypothetical protein
MQAEQIMFRVQPFKDLGKEIRLQGLQLWRGLDTRMLMGHKSSQEL